MRPRPVAHAHDPAVGESRLLHGRDSPVTASTSQRADLREGTPQVNGHCWWKLPFGPPSASDSIQPNSEIQSSGDTVWGAFLKRPKQVVLWVRGVSTDRPGRECIDQSVPRVISA
jgi:hypothetical protein